MSGFRFAGLYHPSHHVPDLDEAEAFFERVFGRTSTRLASLSARSSAPRDGFSNDYCTFTPIADVLFDCIDPARYLVEGRRPYEPVTEPSLRGLGWYVEGIAGLHTALRAAGLTVVDQLDRVVDGDDPPTAAGSSMPLLFTTPADAGLRHELLPPIPFALDHRQADGWTLGPPAPDDPLGVVGCAHHTVTTRRPERARRLLVDVFGGTVIHEGHDELLDATATYVRLADTVIELAVPTSAGAGAGAADRADQRADDGAAGDDYGSIAWEVVDLARAEAHLVAEGVGIAARTDRAILTVPATGLGIAWRFSEGRDPVVHHRRPAD